LAQASVPWGGCSAPSLAMPLAVPRLWQSQSSKRVREARAEALAKTMGLITSGAASLDLAGNSTGFNGVDDVFVAQLVEVLETNSSVVSLHLERNNLGDTSAQALARILKRNGTLKALELDYNNIGDSGISNIANGLQVNAGLHQLDLIYNRVGHQGAERLADALITNNMLKTLTLHGNPIGDAGAAALAQALPLNRSLQSLSLHAVNLGDEGASRLSWSLHDNRSIKELCLGCNRIMDPGAAQLARMLKDNTVLQELRLENNNIGEVGGLRLAEALENNRSLKELSLLHNPIGNRARERFAKALKKNDSLLNLSITAQVGDKSEVHSDFQDINKSQKYRRTIRAIEEGIECLVLCDQPIGNNGAARVASSLENNQTLLSLSLERCEIGDEGAIRLAHAFERNNSLQEVSLIGNKIGDVGALRLMEVLEVNPTIYEMDLGGNPIGPDVQEQLAAASRLNFGAMHDGYDKVPGAGRRGNFETLKSLPSVPIMPVISNSCSERTEGAEGESEGGNLDDGEGDLGRLQTLLPWKMPVRAAMGCSSTASSCSSRDTDLSDLDSEDGESRDGDRPAGSFMMNATSGFRSGRFVPASFRTRPFVQGTETNSSSTIDEQNLTTGAPTQTTLKFAPKPNNRGTENGHFLAPPPVKATLKFAKGSLGRIDESSPGINAEQSKLQFRRPGDAGNVATASSPAVRGAAVATAARGASGGVSSASWESPLQIFAASEVNEAQGDIGAPDTSSCGSADEGASESGDEDFERSDIDCSETFSEAAESDNGLSNI